MAITDHNTLEGYFRVRKLARSYEDLVILPGIEIGTEEGDLIILGVEEKPTYPVSLSTLVDFARETGGTVVIPHPYRSLGIGDCAMNINAHAVEILNPTATRRENVLAQELSRTRNLPGVAGTDAHNAAELWTVCTEVEAQPTVDGVLTGIRKGLVKAISTRSVTFMNKNV